MIVNGPHVGIPELPGHRSHTSPASPWSQFASTEKQLGQNPKAKRNTLKKTTKKKVEGTNIWTSSDYLRWVLVLDDWMTFWTPHVMIRADAVANTQRALLNGSHTSLILGLQKDRSNQIEAGWFTNWDKNWINQLHWTSLLKKMTQKAPGHVVPNNPCRGTSAHIRLLICYFRRTFVLGVPSWRVRRHRGWHSQPELPGVQSKKCSLFEHREKKCEFGLEKMSCSNMRTRDDANYIGLFLRCRGTIHLWSRLPSLSSMKPQKLTKETPAEPKKPEVSATFIHKVILTVDGSTTQEIESRSLDTMVKCRLVIRLCLMLRSRCDKQCVKKNTYKSYKSYNNILYLL